MQSASQSITQETLHGLLLFDVPEKPAVFIEQLLVSLSECFGEFTSIGLVGEGLPKEERYHYNAKLLKDPKEMGVPEEALCLGHSELMRRTVDRLYRAEILEVEVGLAPGWLNPYVHDSTQLHLGMHVSLNVFPDHWQLEMALDKPDLWFAKIPKPLFESDPMVRQHSDVKWNVGEKGIVVARGNLVEQNRHKMALHFIQLIQASRSRASFLGFGKVRYHWKTQVAHISKFEDTKNQTPALLMIQLAKEGKLETTNPNDKRPGSWILLEGGGLSLEVEDSWFDHLSNRDLDN